MRGKVTGGFPKSLPVIYFGCLFRNFGDKAYERHVEWCKDQQSRIPKSPNNVNLEAKERWEARTKVSCPKFVPRRPCPGLGA